ncbi:SAM-dependent methyltransferase (plasmid) [Ralstonia solanacearum]|nr:SAM-dependent DNA methyltransferase [Ralstonia solanacearum]QWF62997.1 SAM-dependent methyltransferase [Ralstonia solanacearum]RAA04648.1 SAM-dependent DNA methyltransferase [Ralstonia pseudosolanacearum]
MAKAKFNHLDSHQQALVKLIEQCARRHRRHEVFRDFCELAALSISNRVDLLQYDEREARYLEIVKRYEREEVECFPRMLGCLVESLEGGRRDALGTIFEAMQLADHWKGQFFTPFEVSRMMAKMMLSGAAAEIECKGFITLMEPAAGAGGMVIASASALLDQGINYQQTMHATLIDIDAMACHMAYVQLSLLHVPAIVIHGNALVPDMTWGHWVTPAHVMGLWDARLRRRDREQAVQEAVTAGAAPAAIAAPEPVAQQRAAIVERRIEQSEQLDLFT